MCSVFNFKVFKNADKLKSPEFSFLSFAFCLMAFKGSPSVGPQEVCMSLLVDWKMLYRVNALVMPYYKDVPISSLTSVRKATIFRMIPSNHDLTRLRVERQPSLFKVVTQCSLSQSDRLSAVTNRWAHHFYISLVKIAQKRSISCYLGQFWDNSLS